MPLESLLTEQELLAAVAGKIFCGKNTSEKSVPAFTSVATDSRNVVKGTLFVPLIGTHQDGHAFISDAVKKGASVVFAAEQYASRHCDDLERESCCIIIVDNTLSALQRAAKAYVKKFPSLIKIGITGSSGKTTTKEIAAAVLSQKYEVLANEGNLNSETGLPLSVFKIREKHQVGIFEMGMNRSGEIAELASVLIPDYAIITNIGTAHIGILGSKEAIAEEKKHIFMYFSEKCTGFIPANDEFADFLAEGAAGTIIRYGTETTLGAGNVCDCGLSGTRFVLDGLEIMFPLCGKYNAENMSAVAALAKAMGLSAEQIKAGLESMRAVSDRMEIRRGSFTVIRDCYNANPDSMKAAVSFINELSWKTGRKILVLGDMLELGSKSAEEHKKIGKHVCATDCALAVFWGEEMQAAADAAGAVAAGTDASLPEIWAYKSDSNAEDAAARLFAWMRQGDIVLFKGSRGMHLERIAASLDAMTSGSFGQGNDRIVKTENKNTYE